MAKAITESFNEKVEMIDKILKLDKEKATMFFERVKYDKPPQAVLRKTCRDIAYVDIPLDCLLYLWTLSDKVSMEVRLKAKVSYLARVNEHNHPRQDKFFTLDESNNIDKKDELKLFNNIYKDEMKALRKNQNESDVDDNLEEWNLA